MDPAWMMAGRGGDGHSARTITTVLGFHAAEGLFILGMHEEAIDVGPPRSTPGTPPT
jgi:hypothetical protein